MVGNTSSDYNPVCAVVLKCVVVSIADGRWTTDGGGGGDRRTSPRCNQCLHSSSNLKIQKQVDIEKCLLLILECKS